MQKKNNNNKINRVVSLVQWSRRPVLLLLVALFYRKWRRTSSAFFFVSIDFVDVLFLHRLFIIAVFFAGFCSVCFYLTEIDSTLFFSHFLSAKQLLIGSVPNFVFFQHFFYSTASWPSLFSISCVIFAVQGVSPEASALGQERERERDPPRHHRKWWRRLLISVFSFFFSLSHSIPSSIQFSTSIVVAKRNTFIVRVFFNWLSLSRVVRRESRQKKKGTKPEEIDESTAIADWSRPLKRPINVPTLRATRQNPVTPNSWRVLVSRV